MGVGWVQGFRLGWRGPGGGWLRNSVNPLNAPEPSTAQWLKWCPYVMCVLPQ